MSDLSIGYNQGPTNRLINNTEFVKQLLNSVKNKLKRPLIKTEAEYVLNLLRTVNKQIFKNSPTEIFRILETEILKKINTPQCYEDQINIHEMLKDEMGILTEDRGGPAGPINATPLLNTVNVMSILGSTSLNDLKTIFNPVAAKKSIYVVMDSRYRVLDNDGRATIKWNFTSNPTSIQGSVNAIGDIQNITSMRVSPIQMPYISQADNDYKRITMYIQEFSAQSIIAHENRQYHFMFPTSVNDRYINLEVNRDSDGYFKFRNPISRIDSLSISFASPLQPIIFDLDRQSMLVSDYSSNIVFVSLENHNVETGDIVYISLFTTANPNYDANIISSINNIDGNIATYIDDTHISLNIDCSSLKIDGTGTINVINNDTSVIGVGTSFTTLFVLNDIIEILGIKYTINSIISDTQLVISIAYIGITANTLTYKKNNTIPGMNPNFYFGSKRMFIALEFEYFESI